jgi:L-phenylalanine/L-methionine N-acetyltransferase
MIRPIQKEDFDFIYDLYMHPQVNPYLLYEWMDKKAFRPIFKDLLKKRIIYIYGDNGQDIGMFKIYPHTYRSGHIAYLGGVAVHPDFGGKGYGVKMMHEILDFAKTQGYWRVELSTGTANERAIKLYEKVGFVREGVMRNYTYLKSEDKLLDELLMSYLFERS